MRSLLAMFVCSVVVSCGLAMAVLADEPAEKPAAEKNVEKKPVVETGKFINVYNPNVGEQKDQDWYINDHCFTYGPKGKWHMYGITYFMPIDLKTGKKGRVRPTFERFLAHASGDILLQQPWTKYHHALTYAPQKPWRERHLWAPHIVKKDGTYYMFYCAGDMDNTKYKIHLATSTDCTNWIRHPENPMIVDGFDARDPFLMKHGDKWIMYYTATTDPKGGNHAVVYMTSDDLIHWSNRGIAFTDPSEGKWGGPCESPQVIQRDDKYYLFLGPRNGNKIEYVGTDVYVSKDPFNWKIEGKVAHLKAHAPEVIRDVDGKWYISDCGWGRGGVFIAPLIWNDGLKDPETNLTVPTK